MLKNKKWLFSIILLIISFYFFICIILLPVGAMLLRQETGTWSDIFSLGQFLADLCLMPVAIVGFYLTLNELRKAQDFSDLHIKWENSEKLEYEFLIKRTQLATYQTKHLLLKNEGTSPSTLYQITLEIPEGYGKTQVVNSSGDWKGGVQGENHKFSFTSASHLISFPNAPEIDLGQIAFLEPKALPARLTINYYIASEKSEYKSGKLIINLKEITEI